MQMDDLTKTINELYKQRFLNEISVLKTDTLINTDPIKLKRLKDLEIIYAEYCKNEKSGLDKHLDEINKHVYKKQWHYLSDFHKHVKLVEYLTKHIENNTLREKIIADVKVHLSNGHLNKKINVTYDSVNQLVTAFPSLTINKEEGTYAIKI